MKKSLLALATATAILSGCATIMSKGEPYPVTITSSPSEANFTVTNKAGTKIAHGVTPQTLSLKAFAGPYSGETYTITFTKTGYQSHSIKLDSTVNGWYVAGNLIFGGFLGWLVVDPATGAMFSLPETATAELQAINQSSSAQGLNIISIEQLDENQRAQLQPLAAK